MSSSQPSGQSDEVFLDRKTQKFSPLFSSVDKITMKSTTVKVTKVAEQTGDIPQERSGHFSGLFYEVSRVEKGNGNSIEIIPKCLTFGGDNIAKEKLNDLFELDFNTYKWKKIDYQQSQAPEPRVYFSGCINKQTGRLYIFGGDSGTIDQRLNNFYEYTIATQQWRKIQTNGYSPEKRSGHSCCILPDTGAIVIFGGLNNLKKFNDLSIFDFETNRWEKVTKNDLGDVPEVRCAHSAVIFPLDFDKSTPNFSFLQQAMTDPTFDVNFPFFEDDETIPMSDLTSDTDSDASTKKSNSSSSSSSSISAKKIRLIPVQKLVKNSSMLANMTRASCSRMIVFGGRKDNQSLYNDTYEYNFVTKMWKRLETVGNQPAKREGHVAARISPFEMVIFGGYNRERDFNDMYKLDLRTNTWIKIAIVGDTPNPMCYMSCVSLFDPDVGAPSSMAFLNNLNGDSDLKTSTSSRVGNTRTTSSSFVSDNGVRSSSMYSVQSNPFLAPPSSSSRVSQQKPNENLPASSAVAKRSPTLNLTSDPELAELDAEDVQSTVTAPVSTSSGYYEDEDTVPPSMMETGGYVVPVFSFGGWSQTKVNDLFRFDFIYEPPSKFHYTERLLHYVYENLFNKSMFFDVLIGCTASEDSNFSEEGMIAMGINPFPGSGALTHTSSSVSLRSDTSSVKTSNPNSSEKKEVFVMGHRFIISQSPVLAKLLEENCTVLDSKTLVSDFLGKNTIVSNSSSSSLLGGGGYVSSSFSSTSSSSPSSSSSHNAYFIIKLKNITQDILSKILEYLYGSEPDFTQDEYPIILEKSVELKLESVKNWALSKFDAKISNRNVFQILKFSEVNNQEFLKGKCLSYIQKNKKELLQQKTEMKSLSKELLIELALSETSGEKFSQFDAQIGPTPGAGGVGGGGAATIFGNSQSFYSKKGIIRPQHAFLRHMLTNMPEVSLNQKESVPMSPNSKQKTGSKVFPSPEKSSTSSSEGTTKIRNKYFDVEFLLPDGVVVKAHKAILTIRSVFFHSMFNSGFLESKMSQIELTDVKTRPLMFVLLYLYGIPLFVPEETAAKDLIDIFATSNLLSLKEVERDALKELCARVNTENLGEMIEIVAKYKLKGSSLEMECRSQLEKMSQSEVIDWVFCFAKKFSFN